MELLIFMVGMFAVMWLLLIRPQRRRRAAQAEMLASLEVGDEIVTAGGLYGRIEALDEDDIRLEIAPGTKVRVARHAVAAVVSQEADEESPDAERS